MDPVRENHVSAFCKICDYYRTGEHCSVVGFESQHFYVSRNWCGWGNVESQTASITRETVKIRGIIYKRTSEEQLRQTVRNLPVIAKT